MFYKIYGKGLALHFSSYEGNYARFFKDLAEDRTNFIFYNDSRVFLGLEKNIYLKDENGKEVKLGKPISTWELDKIVPRTSDFFNIESIWEDRESYREKIPLNHNYISIGEPITGCFGTVDIKNEFKELNPIYFISSSFYGDNLFLCGFMADNILLKISSHGIDLKRIEEETGFAVINNIYSDF